MARPSRSKNVVTQRFTWRSTTLSVTHSLALDFVPVGDNGRLVVRANKPNEGEQPSQGEARR